MKLKINKQISLVFGCTSSLFVLTRLLLFQGFNGTDDLHYAMLASKLLNGTYNPFEINDIFSGRILLISIQASIYKLGGISAFTTGIGTVVAVLISCWLTVYKLLPKPSPAAACVVCCLFYFNPVLTEAIKGILPDAYIMLSGVIVFLLIKPALTVSTVFRSAILKHVTAGIVIALTLLIKETILIFLPFAVLMQILYNGKKGLYNSFFLLLSFLTMLVIFGCMYQHFAGNAFIKILQIRNSAYPNPCNFDNLPLKDFIARLTYSVYTEFIVNGLYPAVLGCVVLIARFCNWRNEQLRRDINLVSFGWLLLISLYFPFSLKGYQPLCASSRQFLFLTPFAIPLIVQFLFDEEKKLTKIYVGILLLITTGVCFMSTGNKWQLMIYLLIFSSFLFSLMRFHFLPKLHILLLSTVLFVSIFENLFFRRSHWFRDMQKLSDKINAEYFYFPDHDNMMHWKLLHGFNETGFKYFTIEKDPFPIFKIYDERPDQNNFHPGWLIINKRYTVLPKATMAQLDSLQENKYRAKRIQVGEVEACFIGSTGQLFELENVIEK